ncbi:hypothetical protein GNP64_19180 [Aliivibrio fischeri]|uniref:hypothetical protein n=1 Tax=Aliivibrio fischeri TaxID=668 RepID=UPI0012DA5D87|nr:hypothetical protein [Aliivibrio fischeri]MUL08125.1 hypothetical protein [Aliivibrio fischeri]
MKANKDDFVTCKICSKLVKNKNMRKHLRKLHKQHEDVVVPTECPPKVVMTNVDMRSLRRQETFARINQGEYDNEKSLMNFINNAKNECEQQILKAAQQRLRKKYPNLYRRYVGPLTLRDPLGSKKCYCAIHSSLHSIANDIMNLTVPTEALQCDLCWDQDISSAWGTYGQWGAKKIDTPTWTDLCTLRGDTKYATA